MTIGSTMSMTPMPAGSSSAENMRVPVAPVQPTASRDNEAKEGSSADDSKASSDGIDTYA